MRHILMMKRAH